MIVLTSLSVTSFDLRYLQLAWSIETTSENIDNYALDIYRSESPGVSGLESYNILASGIPASDYDYLDYTVSGLSNPNRTWFYKFNVINIVTGATEIQPTVPLYRKGQSTSYVTKEILRRKNLSLTKKSGTTFYLVKKRNSGTRCSRCWDSILQRAGNGTCPVCYGTGFLLGYYTPIEFKATSTTSPKYNQVMMFGEWKPSDKLLYTTMYPPITPRDFIVDDSNNRWIVLQCRFIQQLGFNIEQIVQTSLILPDDVIYNVSI